MEQEQTGGMLAGGEAAFSMNPAQTTANQGITGCDIAGLLAVMEADFRKKFAQIPASEETTDAEDYSVKSRSFFDLLDDRLHEQRQCRSNHLDLVEWMLDLLIGHVRAVHDRVFGS